MPHDADAAPRHTVTVEPGGASFDAPEAQTLLRSAHAAGLPWPSSCRNGTCRRCLTRLRAGSVRYSVEWPGLLPEEKTEGWTLPCVAHPTSDLRVDDPVPVALRE